MHLPKAVQYSSAIRLCTYICYKNSYPDIPYLYKNLFQICYSNINYFISESANPYIKMQALLAHSQCEKRLMQTVKAMIALVISNMESGAKQHNMCPWTYALLMERKSYFGYQYSYYRQKRRNQRQIYRKN